MKLSDIVEFFKYPRGYKKISRKEFTLIKDCIEKNYDGEDGDYDLKYKSYWLYVHESNIYVWDEKHVSIDLELNGSDVLKLKETVDSIRERLNNFKEQERQSLIDIQRTEDFLNSQAN